VSQSTLETAVDVLRSAVRLVLVWNCEWTDGRHWGFSSEYGLMEFVTVHLPFESSALLCRRTKAFLLFLQWVVLKTVAVCMYM